MPAKLGSISAEAALTFDMCCSDPEKFGEASAEFGQISATSCPQPTNLFSKSMELGPTLTKLYPVSIKSRTNL